MKIHKRSLTLLELLLAMGLAIGLLTSSLFFYRYTIEVNQQISAKEKKAFEFRLVQFRLNDLFQRVHKDVLFFTKQESPLTKGPSLLMKVKNPPFDIPSYSGDVLILIFVDNEKRLSIATWPFNQSYEKGTMPDMHLEVVALNVESVDFQFLVGNELGANAEMRAGAWTREWLADFKAAPAAVKMILHFSNGEKELAFPIACTKEPS